MPERPKHTERPDTTTIRGITISCQTWGWEWGTDGFAEELDELVALGANWVAIHPYARVHADGRVTWRELDVDDPPEWLARPIREARRRGLAIFIKPHLAYWGSPFAWRGEIAFEDPLALERFFDDYGRWIVSLARVTRQADGFALGTELDRLVGEEQRWRALVAAVRAVTDARLTYAANWPDVEAVPFWDALDAVGVQAYFPLSEAEQPDEGDLLAGWRPVIERLRGLHVRTGKPVIFTEFGYNCSLDAAREPWSYEMARGETERAARALQARCLGVALAVLERERDWLRGGFLWKWFVGPAPRANFQLDAPETRAVISAAWR